MPQDDLKIAWAKINAKRTRLDMLMNYYDGKQQVGYTHQRVAQIFRGFQTNFVSNWCAVVVDALLDRIVLTGASLPEPPAPEDGGEPPVSPLRAAFETIWKANAIDLESYLAHESALACGEAFVICGADATGAPVIYFNDPRGCHVEYDANNPRVRVWACKLWNAPNAEGTEVMHAQLYYPDHFEHYATTTAERNVHDVAAFRPAEPLAEEPNPYGAIPVFHLRRHLRREKSDLDSVVPLQNAVNKLLADMMVTAEFGAYRQRWIIKSGGEPGGIEGAEGSTVLRNRPGSIWEIPGAAEGDQPTQVGDFDETDMGNYLAAIEHLVAEVGSISRTPRHFFMATGAQPSGEALIAQEAPLNRKAAQRTECFTPVWREAFQLLLKIAGFEVPLLEIAPTFEPVESLQPETEARTIGLYVQAGLPLEVVLPMFGWDTAQMAALETAQTSAEEKRQATLGEVAARAMLDFERGGQGAAE